MQDTPESQPCPRCSGNGICHDCQGTGHIPCPACSGEGGSLWHGKRIPCKACNGTGQLDCPTQCSSCGGTGAITAQMQEEQIRKYQPAMSGPKLSNLVTKSIIIVCLVVYALAPPDLPNILPDPYPFLIWKAMVGQANIWQSGEYWRFLTPVFLHGGYIHLGCNMYTLWIIGPQVETVLGWRRYLGLFLLSGIGGCILSAFMNMRSGIGASGAIFGVAAAFVVMSQRWGVFPAQFARSIRNTLALILVIGFVAGGAFGFSLDNWGHIGGAVIGALFVRLMRKI